VKTTTKAEQEPPPPQALAHTQYVLLLFITGLTPRSTQAVANLKAICEEHLAGRYELEVIDLYQQPEVAKGEQIVAAPTLLKKQPLPPRRLVGNLSQTDKVLAGLGIHLGSGAGQETGLHE
jgi:circadian clock protein KaiB